MTKKYSNNNVLPNSYLFKQFVAESNEIEGILRTPTDEEVKAFKDFYFLEKITIKDLEDFVKINQPDARLRDEYGLDVQVGGHIPPFGGPDIPVKLQFILDIGRDSYVKHILYERLHPFTDGNGRSGRALWAWQERDLSLGFLHKFYYQTLATYNGLHDE